MKKLLVIGAGIGQVPLVELAHSMGLYVSVVSPRGNYPAIEIADELFECDIFDKDRIVDYAQAHNFSAVTSDQNDLMMPTVAYVAEKCGLPGNSFEQVLSYCDKNKFRKICNKIGVPCPANIEISETAIPQNFVCDFPWIVKPADSQSSIGISKILSKDDYSSAVLYALSKSRNRKAILEQFFVGEEYVCEGFVYNGKYYNIAFGDRKYFSQTLIPSQTLFPSYLCDNVKNQIIECESRIAAFINPSFGIIHSEYLVNKETNEFCIVESAIRGGGVYISSHLIPFATGLDINRLLLRCVCGENISINDFLKGRIDNASAYVCFCLPEGVIKEVSGIEQLAQIDGVEQIYINSINAGAKTERMIAKGMRKGPILISGRNRDELELIINQIQSSLDIKVLTSDGCISNIIWS